MRFNDNESRYQELEQDNYQGRAYMSLAKTYFIFVYVGLAYLTLI